MTLTELPIDKDWQHVQSLLRQERANVARVTRDIAIGTADRAELTAARSHLESLLALASAIRARRSEAGGTSLRDAFDRCEQSILVVDDHEATCYCISRALKAQGYQTMEANSAAQALELSPFAAAVVLDLHLPDLHGFEVCRLLRRDSRTARTPVVHMTSMRSDHDVRMASQNVGADDFMCAPVDSRQLAERLDGLLRAPAALGRRSPAARS